MSGFVFLGCKLDTHNKFKVQKWTLLKKILQDVYKVFCLHR